MPRHKLRRAILYLLVFLVIFFIAYAAFFRTYIDTEKYLEIAWDYTDHDPHVLNWREPVTEVIWQDGRLLVHMVLHTDQDQERGPYSLYIDPFQQKVVSEDPRQ